MTNEIQDLFKIVRTMRYTQETTRTPNLPRACSLLFKSIVLTLHVQQS